jgi:ectoine hydroxylase-related dioxygenase (phytanoyl-CoA dioxygenase family)
MQFARLPNSSRPPWRTAPLGIAMRRRNDDIVPCTMPNRFGTSGNAHCHPYWPELSRGDIHWDTHPRVEDGGTLQCVALLTDVERNGGGSQCVPGIFQDLDAWLDQNARGCDFDFINPGLNCPTTQIEGKAGDVILWSTKLPHGGAANLSERPRIAALSPCSRPRILPNFARR